MKLINLSDDIVLMQIFLDRKKQLIRVDRLDQIVGDFVSDSLIHNAFFFALGDHHDRHCRSDFFNGGECFEAGQTGHILI